MFEGIATGIGGIDGRAAMRCGEVLGRADWLMAERGMLLFGTPWF